MTFQQIIKDLKNKVYHPVYFLTGEEQYYIDKIESFISAQVLNESEKEFNQKIVYGRDTETATLVNEARRYPMMSNHQVIVVKEAQGLRNPEKLIPYIENPQLTTILVLCHKVKKIDLRSTLGKKLKENAVFFDSKKLSNYKIPDWIKSHVNNASYKINQPACEVLSEYIGNDLSRISNELDKITLNLPSNQEITIEAVESQIGISKEYNVFELQDALISGNQAKLSRIIAHFSANTKAHPLLQVINFLFSFFSKTLQYHYLRGRKENDIAATLKVQTFVVRKFHVAASRFSPTKLIEIISYLREYDLRSKGVNNLHTSDGELLMEMIHFITSPISGK